MARVGLFAVSLVAALALGHAQIKMNGRRLTVDSKPYQIRGVCYSPVPVGMSVGATDMDLFVGKYRYLWHRDLPAIAAMGANTIRIYRWDDDQDHTEFLDTVHAYGLKVFVTHFIGPAFDTPVRTEAERAQLIEGFRTDVARYGNHPAILAWSFGNELNGIWMGYLGQLAEESDYGPPCQWDARIDEQGGCIAAQDANIPQPSSRCYEQTACVYARLFSFIDDAAKAAKQEADVLVVSSFADVDAFHDKVHRLGDQYAPHLDAWTAQLYRGGSFGDVFTRFSEGSTKPLIVTEYGVDAYHDFCGVSESEVCFDEINGTHSLSYPDEKTQADFDIKLTRELLAHSSHTIDCKGSGKGDTWCATLGGFIMAWNDEYWKGMDVAGKCNPTYGHAGFSEKGCTFKAHASCPNYDANEHSPCGYFMYAAPDRYVNEAWFGLTDPHVQCGYQVDHLRPREIYWKLRRFWLDLDVNDTIFLSCEDILSRVETTPWGAFVAFLVGFLVGLALLLALAAAWLMGPGKGSRQARIVAEAVSSVLEQAGWSHLKQPLLGLPEATSQEPRSAA